MGLQIWNDNQLFDSTDSMSVECLKDDNMQLVYYTLKHQESLNIIPDDFDVTSIIMVLEGKLKLKSPKEEYLLNAHDSFMLTNVDISYYTEAIGFTKLMAISNEVNQNPIEDEQTTLLLNAVEEKDIYTMGHSTRVALYAKRLALGYESTYHIVSLSAAARMHDIGKINTPIAILQKPGKLTEEEFAIIKKHPIDSYELLKDKFGERVATAALQHHERLDGSGYPKGLKGDQIGMDARIIAVADVFDAMTCKRVYNEPKAFIEVVEYLEGNLDKYDPQIIAILRRQVENEELLDILDSQQQSYKMANKNE